MKDELNQLKKRELTSREEDKINSLVEQILSKENQKTDDTTTYATMEEWKEEINKSEREPKSLSQKINIIIGELEKEKSKAPAIRIREKEIVKLEPKCSRCNEKEYKSKLEQLRMVTYGALAYSIIITIISIVKNEIVKNDFKTFIEQLSGLLKGMIKSANKGGKMLSESINNEIAQKIIYVGLWVLVAGVIIFGIYKLYTEIHYRSWKFWNIGAVAMLLLDLIIIVYLSEPIHNLTKLNLFIFALLVYAGYVIIRIIINIIRNSSR